MRTTTRRNVLLWTVQGLLAALFLLAGGMKLALPLDALRGPVPLPGVFLRFIGVVELLGAIGLVLPGVFHVARSLTPLAAAGLVTIMSGATVVTIEGGAIAPAIIPLVVGVLAGCVVLGRRGWVSAPTAAASRTRSQTG
jgi:uncharacterized membrane protein YphA (DoxX/SURF4 family)